MIEITKKPMHKIFTSEDLIRFAYNEMNAEESIEFEAELLECGHLQYELQEILEMKAIMDRTAEAASASVVSSLLNYSASLHIVKSSSTGGSFGVVLN